MVLGLQMVFGDFGNIDRVMRSIDMRPTIGTRIVASIYHATA